VQFEVYCDESRQELFKTRPSGEYYVLIGGLWIPAERRPDFKAAIRSLREKHDVKGEFKWNRVSPSRLPFYRALVRLFFDQEDMRFRVIVLPLENLDSVTVHAPEHEPDCELMFYKFYYQLLHHWILDQNVYRVFVDVRTNRAGNRVQVLQRCLGYSNLLSTVSVQALPSDELDLMQLADVLIGAVGYKFHKLDTSKAKLAVVQEIEQLLGRPIHGTGPGEEKFNVFHFRGSGGW